MHVGANRNARARRRDGSPFFFEPKWAKLYEGVLTLQHSARLATAPARANYEAREKEIGHRTTRVRSSVCQQILHNEHARL